METPKSPKIVEQLKLLNGLEDKLIALRTEITAVRTEIVRLLEAGETHPGAYISISKHLNLPYTEDENNEQKQTTQ